MEKIPYSKQSIDATDIKAVTEILDRQFITQGPAISEFESTFAQYCGARYAVAVSSGTSALIIANQALGLRTNERVITTPNTFVATPNSIELNGGIAHLVDIDPQDFNISISGVEAALKSKNDIVGIIPVHFAGVPADMESISHIASKQDLYVIEDACHALGGSWSDSKGEAHQVGDCSHSDMTIFSFHPVKQITTGEGGMVTTNNSDLYHRLLSLRSHGILRPEDRELRKSQPWLYEMHDLSANHRITDIQCALGSSQLKKANIWAKRRTELVKRYNTAFLSDQNVRPQTHSQIDATSYHLYSVQARQRDKLYHFLHEHKILVQVHYVPVHFHPYYHSRGYRVGDFPVCEEFYQHALSLPLYPSLSNGQQDYVIEKIQEFYDGR